VVTIFRGLLNISFYPTGSPGHLDAEHVFLDKHPMRYPSHEVSRTIFAALSTWWKTTNKVNRCEQSQWAKSPKKQSVGVFLTIWNYILSAEKTHSFRLLFLAILPTGIRGPTL